MVIVFSKAEDVVSFVAPFHPRLYNCFNGGTGSHLLKLANPRPLCRGRELAKAG